MSRWLAPALLSLLLLAPATASAQTPADERANARALTDIAIRFNDEVERSFAGATSWVAKLPTCKAQRRLERGTTRQQNRFSDLFAAQLVGVVARGINPPLERAITDWQAVPTLDPALRGGRTAWRRIYRLYSRLASIPHVRGCSEMRDFVRNDYKPTPAMRRASRVMRRADRWDTTDIDRRLRRAVLRLHELGIPKAEAVEFTGESGDDEGLSAQAPAPRSPLNLLRAAS
jgi:hypothetical protein